MDTPLASAAAGLPETCLVVEDESIIRLDLEETLRGFGFRRVLGAATLDAASGIASQGGIGFAVLDYELGRNNTAAIAEQLTAAGVAVVFLSAHDGLIDLPPSLSHLQVIAKPFSSAMLAEAMMKALAAAGQPGTKSMSCLRMTG